MTQQSTETYSGKGTNFVIQCMILIAKVAKFGNPDNREGAKFGNRDTL